ncbi:hypothetical protein SAMN02910263_00782 [Butyrivibrio sp. INlla16]|nr:hypothetical protein SAMN02910263_00782 [Butyrivibrio sp. INlla16]
MKEKNKKVKSYALLVGVVLLALLIMLINRVNSRNGELVVVSVDGEVVKELAIDVDDEFEVTGFDGGKNKVVVMDGVCYVNEADCPDKLCIKQGKISKIGESIICLPHRVVVTIKGSEEKGELDSMSK